MGQYGLLHVCRYGCKANRCVLSRSKYLYYFKKSTFLNTEKVIINHFYNNYSARTHIWISEQVTRSVKTRMSLHCHVGILYLLSCKVLVHADLDMYSTVVRCQRCVCCQCRQSEHTVMLHISGACNASAE
jgi:hypothetical protein